MVCRLIYHKNKSDFSLFSDYLRGGKANDFLQYLYIYNVPCALGEVNSHADAKAEKPPFVWGATPATA